MKIGIAADHAGFEQKKLFVKYLGKLGFEISDYGTLNYDANDDYPDIIIPLALAISRGKVEKGIAICESGVGVSIAANKFTGVRAALITEVCSARQGVEHDNMNMICFGGRTIDFVLKWDLIEIFLRARYTGEESFKRRLDKVNKLEQWKNY